jgi:hypothetical protein
MIPSAAPSTSNYVRDTISEGAEPLITRPRIQSLGCLPAQTFLERKRSAA